jgi:acetyltransferase
VPLHEGPVATDDTATVSDPGKQSRVAAGIPVVAAFDGYRAYAILAIVMLHVVGFSGVLPAAGQNWFAVLELGTLGQAIDVLFIISGFVVFLPTVARGGDFGSVGSYAIRRLARLAPAYWLVLCIILLLTAFVTISPPIGFPSAGNIGAHFVFLQTPAELFKPYPMGFGADGALWTLSLEVTFYVLLPFVAAWYFRRPLLGLACAALITVLWHEALNNWDTTSALLGHPDGETSLRLITGGFTQFPFFAFSFGAGMTGAWAYVRCRERFTAEQLRRQVGKVQLASFVVLGVFIYLVGKKASHSSPVIGDEVARRSSFYALGFTTSLAVLMVATALGAARWQRPFSNPYARRLGDISYGIFLIHMVFMHYGLGLLSIPRDGSLGAFLALFMVMVPPAILYGYLSARYIEQPIRRWAQRYGRRMQRAPAPARA